MKKIFSKSINFPHPSTSFDTFLLRKNTPSCAKAPADRQDERRDAFTTEPVEVLPSLKARISEGWFEGSTGFQKIFKQKRFAIISIFLFSCVASFTNSSFATSQAFEADINIARFCNNPRNQYIAAFGIGSLAGAYIASIYFRKPQNDDSKAPRQLRNKDVLFHSLSQPKPAPAKIGQAELSQQTVRSQKSHFFNWNPFADAHKSLALHIERPHIKIVEYQKEKHEAGLLKISKEDERFLGTKSDAIARHANEQNHITFIALNFERRVIGYVICSQGGFIWYLVVDQYYRRIGLGNRLLTDVIHKVHAKYSPQIFRLNTNANNINAQRLYEKIGFRIYKQDPHNYWYQLDGQSLEKLLAQPIKS